MLSEISQTNPVWYHICIILKKKRKEKLIYRNREYNGGFQGLGERENGDKGYKISFIKQISSEYLMVTMINKAWKLLKVGLKCSQHTHTQS